MKSHIVPIGNSRGVRIPRALLQLCHIYDAVTLSVKGEALIIRPVKHRPRADWDTAFQQMHEHREDHALIEDRLDLNIAPWEW